MAHKKPPPSRLAAAVASGDSDAGGSDAPSRRVPLEDASLVVAFHDRIDETELRFPPGDDHEGRVVQFG